MTLFSASRSCSASPFTVNGSPLDRQTNAARLRHRREPCDDIVDERPHRDRRRLLHIGRHVGAHEREQPLDDVLHAERRAPADRQRVLVLLRRALAIERPLRLGAQHRDGRAKLVRGIGDEPALLLHHQAQPIERVVQRRGHLLELAVGLLDRDARVADRRPTSRAPSG